MVAHGNVKSMLPSDNELWVSWLGWVESGDPSDGVIEILRHILKLLPLESGIIRCKVSFFIILQKISKEIETITKGKVQDFQSD